MKKMFGIGGVFAVITLLVFSAMPVQAWTVSGILNKPAEIYPGDTCSFTLELTNTGSDSMLIDKVSLAFDWQSTDYSIGYPSTDTQRVIGSGDTHTFYFNIPIPDGITTNTDHIVNAVIVASDPGIFSDWGDSSTNSIPYSVFVSTIPDSTATTPDPTGNSTSDSSDDGGGGMCSSIILPAVILPIGMVGIVLKRKKEERF